MTNPRYKMGAVVYDEATRSYRKADALRDLDNHVWAVYDNGVMLCVYSDSDAARQAVQDLNEQ